MGRSGCSGGGAVDGEPAVTRDGVFDARRSGRALRACCEGGERPAGYFRAPLGEEAARFYREQGFLVVEGALDDAGVDSLNAEAAAICRGERGGRTTVWRRARLKTATRVLHQVSRSSSSRNSASTYG